MGFDQVAKALGHTARRQLLVELLAHNPAQADVVERSETAEIALVHNHLPLLDEMGYIAWNRAEGTITKGPEWEEIEPVVQWLSENTDRLPADTLQTG